MVILTTYLDIFYVTSPVTWKWDLHTLQACDTCQDHTVTHQSWLWKIVFDWSSKNQTGNRNYHTTCHECNNSVLANWESLCLLSMIWHAFIMWIPCQPTAKWPMCAAICTNAICTNFFNNWQMKQTDVIMWNQRIVNVKQLFQCTIYKNYIFVQPQNPQLYRLMNA